LRQSTEHSTDFSDSGPAGSNLQPVRCTTDARSYCLQRSETGSTSLSLPAYFLLIDSEAIAAASIPRNEYTSSSTVISSPSPPSLCPSLPPLSASYWTRIGAKTAPAVRGRGDSARPSPNRSASHASAVNDRQSYADVLGVTSDGHWDAAYICIDTHRHTHRHTHRRTDAQTHRRTDTQTQTHTMRSVLGVTADGHRGAEQSVIAGYQ
jgi:hypothetical protein